MMLCPSLKSCIGVILVDAEVKTELFLSHESLAKLLKERDEARVVEKKTAKELQCIFP